LLATFRVEQACRQAGRLLADEPEGGPARAHRLAEGGLLARPPCVAEADACAVNQRVVDGRQPEAPEAPVAAHGDDRGPRRTAAVDGRLLGACVALDPAR